MQRGRQPPRLRAKDEEVSDPFAKFKQLLQWMVTIVWVERRLFALARCR